MEALDPGRHQPMDRQGQKIDETVDAGDQIVEHAGSRDDAAPDHELDEDKEYRADRQTAPEGGALEKYQPADENQPGGRWEEPATVGHQQEHDAGYEPEDRSAR